MAQTVLDRLQRHFRVGPTPHRVAEDTARHFGVTGEPARTQVIAYVRHNYTNYDRLCRYIPHSQIDHFEFKRWVNSQIDEALISRAKEI